MDGKLRFLLTIALSLVASAFVFEAGNKIGYSSGRIAACDAIILKASKGFAHCRIIDGKLYAVSEMLMMEPQLLE
jgi:hypothetical protein